jgi:hypothetical protein
MAGTHFATVKSRFTKVGWLLAVTIPALLPLAIQEAAKAQAPAGRPADGVWTVSGTAAPGTRCDDWTVRLGVAQGRLSGTVSVGQGNLSIQNLVLRPDGGFSGDTPAGSVNNRSVRAYQVKGQFLPGDTVNVTLSNEICPDRTASGRRQ